METCNRVDALVFVWPANQGCLYSVLIDDQPMGEQVSNHLITKVIDDDNHRNDNIDDDDDDDNDDGDIDGE